MSRSGHFFYRQDEKQGDASTGIGVAPYEIGVFLCKDMRCHTTLGYNPPLFQKGRGSSAANLDENCGDWYELCCISRS